jgi:hypothetical protein
MLRHPTKKELMAYAEGRMKGQISAKTGRHVAKCRRCSAEVNAIRASLEFVVGAPGLVPTEALTQGILAAARKERQAAGAAHGRGWLVFRAARGLACAAAVILVAMVSFHGALMSPEKQHMGRIADETSRGKIAKAPSAEDIRKTAVEVSTLAEAVSSRYDDASPSLQERQHRRTVLALDADLSAALVALQENPGCTRAGELVNANLQRQALALKKLYVERSL